MERPIRTIAILAVILLSLAGTTFAVSYSLGRPPQPATVKGNGYSLTYLDGGRGYGLNSKTIYHFDDGTTCLVIAGAIGWQDQVSCARP